MNFNRTTLALIALGSVVHFSAAHADTPDLLDTVKARGTLRIALEGTYPPFNSKDASGQLVGFDVDIARAVAQKMGLKAEFVLTEWSGILAGLQAKKFDVIVNQVAITAERRKVFDFSNPYVVSGAQLIQRQNDSARYNTLGALKGKKLGVGTGSNYEQIAREVGGIQIRTYKAAPDTLKDLSLRRIDAALNDRLLAAYLVKQSGLPLRAGTRVGESITMGIPVRKGNPKFLAAVNKALADLKKDGTYGKISQKWFGQDVSK